MTDPTPASLPRAVSRLAIGAAVAVAAFWLVRLAGFAGTSIFFVDECWHAVVAQAMAASRGLLTSTTALMADRYELDYPPLFHLANAVLAGSVGPRAFIWFNLGVAVFLLGLILIGPGGLLDPIQRASVALVLTATPLFAMYGLRFYAEMLTALLFFASWWWFAVALRTLRIRDAAIAGIAGGLLVWTKQVGWLVLALYGGYFLWTCLRRDTAARRVAAWVVGLALAVSAPYAILTVARGEHPWLFAYPLRHAALWHAVMAGAEVPRRVFLSTLWATYGPLPFILAVLPLGLAFKGAARRAYPHWPLVILLVLLAAVFVVDRRLVERHTLFLLPLAAVLGVDALTRWGGARATLAGFVVVAFIAVHHVSTMPNYRVGFNPSRDFAQMAEVIRRYTPPDAKILTPWWVEVRYHTGRQVLWPVPNLDDPPLDLVVDQEAGAWDLRLRARTITHLLLDDRYVAERPGLGFSRQTWDHLTRLSAEGRVRPLARAGPYRLFEVIQ